jgi:hypothetical protein
MTADPRHQRELKAALKQIEEFRSRATRRWRLDITFGRLAAEGTGVFLLGIFVGLGLYTLFQVVKAAVTG